MVDARQDPRAAPPFPGWHNEVFNSLQIRILSFVIDSAGRVLTWGTPMEDMIGVTCEDAAGRPFAAFLSPAGPPAERVMAAMVDPAGWRGRIALRNRSGADVAFEVETRPSRWPDGSLVISCLATERDFVVRTAQAVGTLDAVFDQAPMGIAIFDRDLRFVRVNAALARIHGVSQADHVGRTAREILPDIDYIALERAQRLALATGEGVMDQPVWGSTPGTAGRIRLWSVSFSMLRSTDGDVIGLCGLVQDATERHRSLTESESARQRLALLDELGGQIGSSLDLSETANGLVNVLVPRIADAGGLLLLEEALTGDGAPRTEGDMIQARRVAIATVVEGLFERPTESAPSFHYYSTRTAFAVALRRRTTLTVPVDEVGTIAYGYEPDFARKAAAAGMHTAMFVPLFARGVPLGAVVLCRFGERPPFDGNDRQLAEDLAARAAISIDNARLYSRERRTALLLQRGLLPQGLPVPGSVEIAHRYLPGSGTAEAGGDWFDVIPLAGRRVALVVGDVMGHGMRAAIIMGQLRTAVRTLAALDLRPAQILRRLDDLARTLSEDHLATFVFVVFDPVDRVCTLARAGHLPPILTRPGESARTVNVPAGAPLGVGGVDFDETTFEVPQDTVLVLYTDGLVEDRYGDLDAEIDTLVRAVDEGVRRWQPGAAEGRWRRYPRRQVRALEELCEELLKTEPRDQSDDVTLLVARLSVLPDEDLAEWPIEPSPSAVGVARHLAREQLATWQLDKLADNCELLVSELITNALRYGDGPIKLRMVRGSPLLCEVADGAGAPPRPRTPAMLDERGRGLYLVHSIAARWGSRETRSGKIVWFEQDLT